CRAAAMEGRPPATRRSVGGRSRSGSAGRREPHERRAKDGPERINVRTGYSTSIAWRPPYQPQLPHTTWGSLACPPCRQMLRAGADSRQLEARRLRLLAFEVFFLGTAIVVSFALAGVSPEGIECRPPGVDGADHVSAVALVAVGPTFGAQTQAVLDAEGCLG